MINILRYYRTRVRGLVPSFAFRRAEQTAGKTLPAASTNFAITPETEVGLRNPWIADVGFAARNPDLPKLATRVTVFRIKNQPYWRVQDKGLGWSIHFNDVETVHVSGRYHTKLLREPYIEEIATAILFKVWSVIGVWNGSLNVQLPS